MTPETAANGADFYLMDDFLSAEDRALRLKVRAFVDKATGGKATAKTAIEAER